MDEQWVDVKEQLPEKGQRVRTLVVKEMVYMGKMKDNSSEWLYDGKGEHGVYSWCPRILKKTSSGLGKR